MFLLSAVGRITLLLLFLGGAGEGGGGSQGRDRKVREHSQILQTIAETEQKKRKIGISLQIDSNWYFLRRHNS